MAGRLLLATAGAVALAAAGLGTVTAQAAPAAADAAAISTERSCTGTPAPGQAACFAVHRTDAAARAFGRAMAQAKSGPRPLAGTPQYQTGLTPENLQTAYGLKDAAASRGEGVTVAIVDAYHAPTAFADVNAYRRQFTIPELPDCSTGAAPCFRQVDQRGGTAYPPVDTGWAQEISLDVDMVSAICPKCSILLVEADSASFADLGAAVRFAASQATTTRQKVVAISNSYGGSDTHDSWYGGPYNQPGIAVTASSGDSGYGVSFPASSKYVTAVGGTKLMLDANGARLSETAWSGAGSGCSRYNSAVAPSGVNTGCTRRAVADVSAVADPNTGVAVYDSTKDSSGNVGWQVFGGTSVSAPIIASVYALAHDIPAGAQANTLPYSKRTSTNLNDVTGGSNGRCSTKQLCNARVGWDGPTGLGTPNGIGAF